MSSKKALLRKIHALAFEGLDGEKHGFYNKNRNSKKREIDNG